jgi:hypothetical protein
MSDEVLTLHEKLDLLCETERNQIRADSLALKSYSLNQYMQDIVTARFKLVVPFFILIERGGAVELNDLRAIRRALDKVIESQECIADSAQFARISRSRSES